MPSNLKINPAHVTGWIVTPDGQRVEAADELVARCVQLWETRADGKQIDVLMAELKRDIATGFSGLDPSCYILVEGVCRVTLKRGAVKPIISNVQAVRDLLGPRFQDLVEVKTTYKVTDKLVDILSSGDDELARALRLHISAEIGEPSIAIVAA